MEEDLCKICKIPRGRALWALIVEEGKENEVVDGLFLSNNEIENMRKGTMTYRHITYTDKNGKKWCEFTPLTLNQNG